MPPVHIKSGSGAAALLILAGQSPSMPAHRGLAAAAGEIQWPGAGGKDKNPRTGPCRSVGGNRPSVRQKCRAAIRSGTARRRTRGIETAGQSAKHSRRVQVSETFTLVVDRPILHGRYSTPTFSWTLRVRIPPGPFFPWRIPRACSNLRMGRALRQEGGNEENLHFLRLSSCRHMFQTPSGRVWGR